jgi:CO dehydrogenase maturation factor
VNHLLRDLIRETAHRFDAVVIDGEAGLEQIHRRVMDMVTHLLIVSDGSLKGRNVAATIDRVASESTAIQKTGVIFNTIRNAEEEQDILTSPPVNLVGMIRENETIRSYDRKGTSFFQLPQTEELIRLEGMIGGFIN